MEYEKMKCPICKKKIKVKTYICRKGVLKGQKIVDVWKHKNCKRYFELVILLNQIEEEKDKLKKKIGIK